METLSDPGDPKNKKIATVNSKGVIKAGKKTGTAKITVTLMSGKKATLKVKVQTSRVRTTKISGLKKNVTLKKGRKLALRPVISPLTSQEKVTYTSSNKKVATVSKKVSLQQRKRYCQDYSEIRKEILCDQSKSKIKSAI